jgi:hypothetical protein
MKVFNRDYTSAFVAIDELLKDFPSYFQEVSSYSNSSSDILQKVSWHKHRRECDVSLSIFEFQDSTSKSATLSVKYPYNKTLIDQIASVLEKQGFEVSLRIDR